MLSEVYWQSIVSLLVFAVLFAPYYIYIVRPRVAKAPGRYFLKRALENLFQQTVPGFSTVSASKIKKSEHNLNNSRGANSTDIRNTAKMGESTSRLGDSSSMDVRAMTSVNDSRAELKPGLSMGGGLHV